jgi:serpin B
MQFAILFGMKKTLSSLSLSALSGWSPALSTQALFVAACSSPISASEPRVIEEAKSTLTRNLSPSSADVGAFVAGNSSFAVDIMKALAVKQSGNLVFSPHSISLALAMTYAGADGQTAAEMKKTLHFALDGDRLHEASNALDQAIAGRGKNALGKDGQPFRLKVNNALFGQTGFPFEAPFLDNLARNYGAGMLLVDYKTNPAGAANDINAWVESKTERKIKNLVKATDFTGLSRLTLVNTVYMNAAWASKFRVADTAAAPFATASGPKSVPTMSQTTYTKVVENADGLGLVLPFDGNEVSMVLVQPNDLPAYERNLTVDSLNAYVSDVPASYVALSLPKFRLEPESIQLGDLLKELGMPTAFGDEADFSKMSAVGKSDPQQRVRVQKVVHKGFIDVGEGGVEAAAATAVVVAGTSGPPKTKIIKFDRPFVYGIRDNASGAWLFLGHVMDPTQQKPLWRTSRAGQKNAPGTCWGRSLPNAPPFVQPRGYMS